MRFVIVASALGISAVALGSHAEAQFSTPAQGKTAVFKPLAPQPFPPGVSMLVGGADECANADAISGTGSFTVDTTASTTGAPQGVGCVSANRDVWFSWTSPSSGSATIAMCGGTTADTVMTVWNGPGCAGVVLACNDDSCGLQSQVSFPASAGSTYMLQLGAFGAATTYTGTFSISISAPPPNDACTAPQAISGTGSFAFDTSGATTGIEGQTEALCLLFGTTTIEDDVWFDWTAPTSGTAVVSTCAGTAVDTRLAAYAGAGCPAAAALACNDDSCSLQSEISFGVVAGAHYALQLGNYPGQLGGTGTLTIAITSPDDCATPTPITGVGTFAFDTSAATTGGEGQSESACLFFGTTAIANDVWFDWTCPANGNATVSLCGGALSDTKIAAYDGAGCPTTAALACNDDTCALQSSITFACVAGQRYALQIGSYVGTLGEAGTFTISIPSTSSGCTYDDGSSENSIGLTAGGDLGWFHRFGAVGDSTIVSSISVAYGTSAFPGTSVPDGTPATVYLWDDPNDDGNPNDLVVIASAATAVANSDTDTLVLVSLAPTAVSGVYFAGVVLTHVPGQFPATLDQTTSAPGRAWIVGSAAGTLDPNNLAAATIATPTDIGSFGLPGNWLVRAGCSASTGTTICASTSIACPCSNGGIAGHGCANSVNANGALLAATGSASIAGDTLVLLASGMPNGAVPPNFCTFFQGTSAGSGVVFGDGVSCMVAPLVRLGSRPIVGGSSAFGHGVGADPDIHVQGGIVGPVTRHYQTTYRNVLPFCTPAGFNITNGVSIVWN